MPRVVHFELPVDDPQRAMDFYQQVFGWHIEKWSGPMDYWLVSTGKEGEPGINGGLCRRKDPAHVPSHTVEVSSVDEYLMKITTAGGAIVMPKTTVPGVGYLAYCKDPEGNIFSIMHMDSSAK